MRIALTGVSGFAARHVARAAVDFEWDVQGLSRDVVTDRVPGVRYVCVGNGEGGVDYWQWPGQVDMFVHLAGRAHIIRETAPDPRRAFWDANVTLALEAFRRAEAAGARRFIFVSSIGVHGSASNTPISAKSELSPHALYAESKLAAEVALRQASAESATRLVIVRPPLMYGPGVGANFLRLIKLVDSSFPLPFGAIDNRRSFLGIRNFASFILHLCNSDSVHGEQFVPADREVISTPELVRVLSNYLGRRSRLIGVPRSFLNLASRLTGIRAPYVQLCESLYVDVAVVEEESGWQPPYSQAELLRETIEWYRS